MSRRVVITGSGFVLPLGDNREDVLSALQEPHGPFLRSEADPHVAVCPVPGFDLKSHVGRCKNARYLTRGQQLCLAAAVRAVDDAGLAGQSLDRAGLFLGLGPNLQASPRDDRALWLLDYLPNTVTSVMAEILGAHGENLTILTACAASTQALGQAFRTIASGLADVALAGGGDSRLSSEGIRAYGQAGVLATGFERPELACRPFDRARCGFAIGEGGAVFALESLEHAKGRGARILAEIVSASSTLDGCSLTGPDPSGKPASMAVQRCLESLPGDGICVLAHGTGTVLNDAVEGEILAATVPHALAISAFKSRIGHLAAACGSAELTLGLICAAHGQFPGIAGLENPCRDDLPLLREPTRLRPASLLLQSFGFGGQNACLGGAAVDLDFHAFDPSTALEAILFSDARRITTRTAKSLPAYLALEAMAQTCGLHLRHRHEFRVQAYLVSMTDLPYAPGLGDEPLTICAALDAETRAGASYSLTVNGTPAGRIVMGRHSFADAPDTLFRNRFACLSSTSA